MKKQTTQTSQESLFETLSGLVSAIGSKARLKILYVLSQAPRPVDALSQITGESIANISQHLQKLLHEGLVVVHKNKLSRIYSLSDINIALLLENLFDLAENISPRLAKVSQNLADHDSSSMVTLFSVMEAIQNNKALMLDVRDSYEIEHTPVSGAIALPLEKLKNKAKSLSKNKTYYLFCRGRACEQAIKGVNLLRSLGFKAYRLKESPVTIRQITGSPNQNLYHEGDAV